MDWITSNVAKSGTDEHVAAFLGEAARGRARKYIEKMNSAEGYPMYALPDGFDMPRTFGVGSLGIPMLFLSVLPLVWPFWLWVTTIETGFPYFIAFGLRIMFLPLQIMGYLVHIAMLFLGGAICKKFRMRHYGAARGVEIYKFIFWDVSVRVALIPAGAFYFGWVAYTLLISYP